MEIKQQLVASRAKTNSGVNGRKGVYIHETANVSPGAGAQAHANLQSNGNVRQASWHFSVDDLGPIQSFLETVRCWHGGTAAANNNYVAIEICVNPDSDFVQAVKNTAELVRYLRQHGVGNELHQHFDATGKDCPNFLRDGSRGVTWAQFVDWVTNGTGAATPTPAPVPAPAPAPTPDRNADGSLRLDEDGDRGPATIGRWQEVMGTPIDFKISKPESSVIKADQRFLNTVVDRNTIRSLTGKPQLDTDGDEGPKTVKVRQFWLYNTQGYLLGRPPRADDFDGDPGPETTKLHQHALNLATTRSGRY